MYIGAMENGNYYIMIGYLLGPVGNMGTYYRGIRSPYALITTSKFGDWYALDLGFWF